MAPLAATQDSLYFAEVDNCRARAVSLASGTIRTFAVCPHNPTPPHLPAANRRQRC